MKKLLLVLVLSLSVAGCATLQKGIDTISTVVVGINNPITNNELYALENSMIVAFAGLNAYKRSCVAGAIPSSCRDVVRRLQTYTRRIPPALTTLRRFVRDNDQVNARIAYGTVTQLLADFKGEAARNGVAVR
jgi:hypothetical protein